MSEFSEKLYTPKQLDEERVISLVQQWKERRSGRLKCYRIGRKILYSDRHISEYLALCEQSNAEEQPRTRESESEEPKNAL
jgi:hypothetical protein